MLKNADKKQQQQLLHFVLNKLPFKCKSAAETTRVAKFFAPKAHSA